MTRLTEQDIYIQTKTKQDDHYPMRVYIKNNIIPYKNIYYSFLKRVKNNERLFAYL